MTCWESSGRTIRCRILLCSDGLFKAVAQPGIVARLGDPEPAEALLQAAPGAGAKDNVTALVTQV